MNTIERLNKILLSEDKTSVTEEAVIRLLDRTEREREGVKDDSEELINLSDKIDILIKVLSKLI